MIHVQLTGQTVDISPFGSFVSPQTLQSEHSIYFTKINVERKPKRNQYSLYYLGSLCDNFLFSSLRVKVVRWHSVSNSKDNGK